MGCAYAVYIFGKFACKVKIQQVAFALPLTLTTPVTLAGLIGLCYRKDADPCTFDSNLPSHAFFQCPVNTELDLWFGSFGSWMWFLWFLSAAWIARHIWVPKSQRLAATEQMFGRPYFSGKTFLQSLAL